MKCAACLAAVVVFAGTSVFADHHEEGFISLFDGKTLKGWDGNSKFWSVRDGAITGQTTSENPTKGNTFIIWRGGTVDDFELRLKFKIAGGNSGIQYRSKDRGNWVVGGYQADFEAGDTFSGILYEEKGRGILARRGQLTHITAEDGKHKINVIASLGDTKEINTVIKKEGWNDYQILARGNQLLHIINGRVTCQVKDDDAARAAKSGILALQLHAGPPMIVQFKDIRIKPYGGIDVSGAWEFEVDVNGNAGTPQFSFKIDGGQLAGNYSGLLGESTIQGSQHGTRLKWTLTGEYNGQEVTCDYEGELTGFGQMQGTVTFNDGALDGTWTAKKK